MKPAGGAARELAGLRWRCRRGVKELDVLLEQFLVRCVPELDPGQVAAFSALLQEQDPDILDWVMGRSAPHNTAYLPLLDRLRQLRASAGG